MTIAPARRLSRTARFGAALAAVAGAATLALVTVVPAGAGEPGFAQPAPGAPSGYLRVGHLAPAVPAVDITLATFAGTNREVVKKAAYGAVTDYVVLEPGTYTIAMRPAGAPQETPPVLSQAVDITAGSASTVLVFATGAGGQPEPRLTVDDLSAPPAGLGRLRIVQGTADLPPVEVTPVGAAPIATALAYGTTTPYTTLAEGRWTLQVKAGDKVTEGVVDVRAGSSSTIVVVNGTNGPELRPLVDNTAAGPAPTGGVETGGGGTAGGR
ncbi:MAG: DUF4397 domain-containing protein [Pseudonocardia sp.]